MARTDVIVLGAGIVGVSAALQLAKSGLSVALIDRGAPGRETSYGNAGIIEANTIVPPAFPPQFDRLFRILVRRSAEADYHPRYLLRAIPWLLAYRAATTPKGMVAFAQAMRPLFARALAEHEILMEESGARHYLHKNGWLKIYRTERGLERIRDDLDISARFDIQFHVIDRDGALELEPSLSPIFRRAVMWPGAANVTNPLEVTKAYLARFTTLGGIMLKGEAMSLHRSGGNWRVETDEGPVDAKDVVVALGPWSTDLLAPLGFKLPLGIKRGYHRHFRPRGNAVLSRPVLDGEVGFVLAPMEQGIRVTTGAEIAARDAPATPNQLARLMPAARELFPLGDAVEDTPWLGKRPCFPDSRPAVGPLPGHPGLWLDFGHAHWGLTLGPATGRLVTELITGKTPFCDPAPYAVDRFL